MKKLTNKSLALFLGLFCFLNVNQAKACSFKAAFAGDTMACGGSTANYATTATSGHYYRWVVQGGNLVSGSGTSSIYVSWPSPGIGSVKLVDSTSACKDSVTKTIHIGLSGALLMAATYKMVGSTTSSGSLYTLTTNGNGNENSGAWNQYKIDLTKNFDFSFTTNQSSSGTPADGMMFVMQNTGTSSYSSSGQGSDMGYYNAGTGNMDQSVGIEEDIYLSGAGYDDSSSSHIALVTDKNPQPVRAQAAITPALSNGKDRTLRVTWNHSANLLEIYFDGTKYYSWNNDLIKNVFKGNPYVWFGFTGATGGSTSTQTFHSDTMLYDLAGIGVSSTTVCAGDSVVLTANGGSAYSWSTGAKTRSIKTLDTGMYSVTVTDSFGCGTSTASYHLASITTVTRPSASFSVSNTCINNGISLTNNTTPTSGVSYEWNFGDGDSTSGGLPYYAYKSAGTYKINLRAYNPGCFSNTSQSVTIYNHPTGMTVFKSVPFDGSFNNGDITSPDFVCVGDTNTYSITSPKGYSNSDYGTKWSIASMTFTTTKGTLNKDTVFKLPTPSKNAYFRYSPSSKFADSLMVLTLDIKLMPGNCDTLISRYIEARPKVVSKFGFTNECAGSLLPFVDSSTVTGGETISQWNWSFGDGGATFSENPKHVYTKPGTYTVTLRAANDAGCGIPVTRTVTQYSNPVAGFSTPNGCQGAVISFTDTSKVANSTIKSQAWTFGDGGKSTALSPTHTYTKSGPYKVKLVTVSSQGCKDSVTTSIRVEPIPVAAFGFKPACVDLPIYFSNKTVDSSSGTTYNWSFGDKSPNSTATLPAHTYKANGSYTVKLIATSKNGCSDSVSGTVAPYSKPVTDFHFSGTCANTAVAFGDSSHSASGSSYDWNYGDGSPDDQEFTDLATHTYTKAGTYKVSLVIDNLGGCTDTETQSVVIGNFPTAAFSAGSVCQGKPTDFNNSSSPSSGLKYRWNFGEAASGKNDTTSLQSPVHTYKTAGTYVVKLYTTNANGCSDSATNNAVVIPVPIVGPWTTNITNYYTVKFTPDDTSQKTYKWYFGTGDSSSLKVPTYTYPGTGKYFVRLVETNSGGCSSSLGDSLSLIHDGIAEAQNLSSAIKIYPNPFADKTTISYALAELSSVHIAVYNEQGKEVAVLRDGKYPSGKYQDVFDADRLQSSAGTYLIKMTVNGELYLGKVVLMK